MARAQSSRSTYDVFLSFRGEDTRYGFTQYLYDALKQNNINAFMDGENLDKGEGISDALIQAIEGSKIAVIVFSETYASSTWCLDELLQILRTKKKGQLVIPVFYKVEPRTVRKQKGSYEIAMANHEKRFKGDAEKVQLWRSALSEAASISGWDTPPNKFEGDFIKEIVKDVSEKLKTISINGSHKLQIAAVEEAEDSRLWSFGDSRKFHELNDGLRYIVKAVSEAGTFGMRHIIELKNKSNVLAVKRLAVKRLKITQISKKDFKSIVERTGAMDHKGLLKLRAYYFSKEEKLLFYDFKPNRSLHLHLHGNWFDKRRMDWEMRFDIALETARGISYIHQSHNLPHGNIKSSNIILTDLYNVRLSEYCLTPLEHPSSLIKDDGYCAPEVTGPHSVSLASDVYSFGVVLMELVTEKNPTNFKKHEGGLPRWVKSVAESYSIYHVIPNQFHSQNSMQMGQVLQVAMACTSPNPGERPSMTAVMQYMEQLKQSRMKVYPTRMTCNTADDLVFNYQRVTYDANGYPTVNEWTGAGYLGDVSRISW